MNNLKPVPILEHGGRKRSGLYANIPVAVLQVPAGEEEGSGGLPNLLKEDEEVLRRRRRRMLMMRRRWRGREGMRRICQTS